MRRSIVSDAAAALALIACPAIAASAAGKVSATQQGVSDPVAAIKAALAEDAKPDAVRVDGLDLLPKTPRLNALLERDSAPGPDGESDAELTFNFLTASQEPADVRDVVVTRRSTGARTMTVVAAFKVFEGRPRTVTSRWVRGADRRWLLDEMSDDHISLTRLLTKPKT